MSHSTDSPPPNEFSSSLPKSGQNIQVDPKILMKALQKMKGLIRGNGVDIEKITLCEAPEDTAITMHRFKARTTLKLIPQYGIRVEPGRNPLCELAPTEVDFKKTVSRIAIDASKIPEKRKQIIDFIFSKSNKGFGINEQRIPFHQLNRNIVQHQRCAPCNNTGRTNCATCHGNGLAICTKCNGRKQILCIKCQGSGRGKSNNGQTIPCQFCRADGRINCTLCHARAQIKCKKCAATGSISCKICAGSGWMSHIANIEVIAQVYFSFERQGLPLPLVQSIEKNPSRCVEKHDIEVAITHTAPSQDSFEQMGKDSHHQNISEPDDSIWIDYEALCPFGPISFEIEGEKMNGSLFGFQSRLINFPNFMDSFTKLGQEALISASKDKKNIRAHLFKAAKFRMIADMITQTLLIKNTARTKSFLAERYTTGVSAEKISQVVDAADLTLRNITRTSRGIGLGIGSILFAAILAYYYLGYGRLSLKESGLPEFAMVAIDIFLLPFGIGLGIMSSKWTAKWSQDKALYKIVPSDILKKTFPNTGKTFRWAIILAIMIYLSVLGVAITIHAAIPDWLTTIMLEILAITHAG